MENAGETESHSWETGLNGGPYWAMAMQVCVFLSGQRWEPHSSAWGSEFSWCDVWERGRDRQRQR